MVNMNKQAEKVKELNKTLGYIEYKDIDDYKQRNQEMIDALKQKSKDELIETIIQHKYYDVYRSWDNQLYVECDNDKLIAHIPLIFNDSIIVKLSDNFMEYVNAKFDGKLEKALYHIQDEIENSYEWYDNTSQLITDYDSEYDTNLRDY